MASANRDGRVEKGREVGKRCDSSILSQQLSHPDDKLHLSELFCFVRCHIEAFSVSLDGKIGVGRVGLRCVHCTRSDGNGGGSPLPLVPATRNGAISYPRATRLVYQSVRNWQRQHFMFCPALPPEVKERLTALQTPKGRASPKKSGVSAERYWEESCKRMGMVDTDKGIKLRTGQFIANDENVSERTKGEVGSDVALEASDPAPIAADKGGAQYVPASFDVGSLKSLGTEVEKRKVPLANGSSDSQNNEVSESQSSSMKLQDGDSNQSKNTNFLMPRDNLRAVPPLPNSPGPHEQPFPEIPPILQGSGQPASGVWEQESAKSFSLNQKQYTAPTDGVEFSSPTQGLLGDSDTSFPLSNDVLLERVSVAHRLVQSMREVCPPTEDDQHGDIADLGSELFELFTGRQPCHSEIGGSDHGERTESVESHAADQCERNMRQRTKREKTREAGCYTNLIDLGFPSALCCVLSSLLGSHGNDGYRTIKEVEEDFRLMAAMPEKYLSGDSTGNLRLANTSFCGREKEVSELLEAFEHATDASRSTNSMVIVTGYSGVGKSSLMQHVQLEFVAKGACVVSGKFDSMQQMQPLSAIASALNDYCDILAQDEERIGTVREAVTSAIGSEGSCLAHLIPNLHKIVRLRGDPPVQVHGREALQRLLFSFRMLFWATCSTRHPVCLFLDDLQWADKVSLQLMQVLVTDTMIEGLLLVVSYRDNEVGVDHPVTTYLGNIRRSGCVSATYIHLDNLDMKSLDMMVSDTLRLMPGTVRPLAEVVHNKTSGNALFAVQFLSSLQDEGLLVFSLASKRVEWDTKRIRGLSIADNVVELMIGKLLRLAPEIQEALSVAAGFGASCKESLLRVIDRTPENFSVVLSLDVAASEGLMMKSDDLVYRFSHDQIQHAAYLLIPESDREKFHLRIGRLLWKSSTDDELEKYLFVVVDQLHRGSCLMTDRKEKIELAELSLLAGKMATAMSAFLPAAAYFRAGAGLLADEDWVGYRDLCLDLHNSCAELEFIVGHLDSTRNHLDQVLSTVVTLQEKLRPYTTLCQLLSAQGMPNEAICSCTEILADLGESLPHAVTPLAVQKEIVATQKLLCTMSDDELRNLQTMQYTEKKEAMKFLEILVNLLVVHKKSYFPLAVCRQVQLSILHGVCIESSKCFPFFGVILCGQLNNLENITSGYRLGKLGLSIMERFDSKEYEVKVHVITHGLLANWVEPIQSSLPILNNAVDVGLAIGDKYNAMVASALYMGTALCSGEPLEQLLEKSTLFMKQITGYQHTLRTANKTIRQVILNLLGQSDDPSKLIGDEIDVSKVLENSEDDVLSAQMHSYCLWLEYLFGHYDRAWETALKMKDTAKTTIARFPIVCNSTFYSGLTAMALARRDGIGGYSFAIDEAIARMELWATSSQWNCQHKLELMRAEYAYLRGDLTRATEEYTSAVSSASRHSFIHEQGIALERSGVFFLETSQNGASSDLFLGAYECYNKWGARSKAAHIQELYL